MSMRVAQRTHSCCESQISVPMRLASTMTPMIVATATFGWLRKNFLTTRSVAHP